MIRDRLRNKAVQAKLLADSNSLIGAVFFIIIFSRALLYSMFGESFGLGTQSIIVF